MPTIAGIVDHWLTEFDLSDVRDIILESLAVVAFLFLLVVVIIAMTKAPMLIGHGSIEMFIFVILGLAHAGMNLFDEFAWIANYEVWKALKDSFLLAGAVILVIGFFRFFLFSARLFGENIKEPNTEEVIEY